MSWCITSQKISVSHKTKYSLLALCSVPFYHQIVHPSYSPWILWYHFLPSSGSLSTSSNYSVLPLHVLKMFCHHCLLPKFLLLILCYHYPPSHGVEIWKSLNKIKANISFPNGFYFFSHTNGHRDHSLLSITIHTVGALVNHPLSFAT